MMAKSANAVSGESVQFANQRLLEAGAVLRVDAELNSSVPVASQEVRSFRHAVLGGRVVAKLTSVDVAPAIDATMEFLGFEAPKSSGPVGLALYGALGFPESALIADPKNARYALGIVKDLNRLARMARSRPGAAKEGMEALAATLTKSVPQFLPSYFEQCGRIFVGNENVTYAGAMFVKARAAEATYGLAINEDHRRAAFLEFAFSGALPAKALDEYAKKLAESYTPLQAYEHFRILAVQRSRGGLAPWAQMMEVVKRMAKAASVDVDSAQAEILSELLGSPSLRFASHTFWKSVRALVIKIAKDDPVVRGGLLNLHPSGEFAGWWLSLLDECGALEALTVMDDSTIARDARALGGPGAWLNRFIEDSGSNFEELPALITKMAGRLKADAAKIQLHDWRMNIECLDLALELGIECLPPENDWFSYSFNVTFARPLLFLGGSEILKHKVRESVRSAISGNDTKYVYAAEGLRPFLVEWIEEQINAIDPPVATTGRGAIDFTDSIKVLTENATATMLGLVPSAHERLRSANGAAAVVRQLRAGLFAEYSWPALEVAIDSIASGVQKKTDEPAIEVAQSWPFAIVHDDRRAIVVDHNETVLEHDLQWPADAWHKQLVFVDGALYVAWENWPTKQAYWTSDPKNIFTDEEINIPYGQDPNDPSLEIPEGGRTVGGRAVKVGDHAFVDQSRVLSDGKNYWTVEGMYLGGMWRIGYVEFDPTTGTHGRRSFPSFVEQHLGSDMYPGPVQLLPLPIGLELTPLGTKDGLLGSAVFHSLTGIAPRVCEVVRIDGKTVRIDEHNEVVKNNIEMLIDWPGIDRTYGVTNDNGIVDLTNSMTISNSATWTGLADVVIPRLYWHHFQIRDQLGSTALRSITEEVVAPLVAAAAVHAANATALSPFVASNPPAELIDLVSGSIPAVTAPILRAAIAETAAKVGEAKVELDAWLSGQVRVGTSSLFAEVDDEEPLTTALVGIVHTSYSMAIWTQLQTLRTFVALPVNTAIGELEYTIERSLISDGLTPSALQDGVPALLLRALLPATPDDERAVIMSYVKEWIDHPIANHTALTCVALTVTAQQDPEGSLLWSSDGTPWWIHTSAHVRDVDDETNVYEVQAVGFRANAAFPDGYTLSTVWSAEPYVATERVRELHALINAHGTIAAMTANEVLIFSSMTGRTRAESALILSGFPGIGYRSREFSKEQRDALGVKASEIKIAQASLESERIGKRYRAIIGACFGEDLAALWRWTPEQFAQNFANAWIAVYGTQTAIDDDLLASVNKLTSNGYSVPSARALLTDMDGSAVRFPERYTTTFDDDGDLIVAAVEENDASICIDKPWIESVIATVALIAHDLPTGSPWRQHAANAIVQTLNRLDNPALVLDWGSTDNETAPFSRLVEDLPVLAKTAKRREYDAGDIIVVNTNDWQEKPCVWNYYLRPAKFGEPSSVRAFAEAKCSTDGALAAILGWLYSERCEPFARDLMNPSLATGSFAQNPLVSVPKLVETISASLDVDTNAATLFLQYLVLSEPTNANIRVWNEWAPKVLAKAVDTLLERELIVSAKRTGAGREVFLHGGWVEMNAPAIGVEGWKLPFYALKNSGGLKQTALTGRLLPLDPIATLFTNGWNRWESGDRPGFESAQGRGLGERKTKKDKS
jgi:hypothetical protein